MSLFPCSNIIECDDPYSDHVTWITGGRVVSRFEKAIITFRPHNRRPCFGKIGSRLTNDRRRFINKFDYLDDRLETDQVSFRMKSCGEHVCARLSLAVWPSMGRNLVAHPLNVPGRDATRILILAVKADAERGPLLQNLLEAPRISSNSELLAYRDSLRTRVYTRCIMRRDRRDGPELQHPRRTVHGEENRRFIRDGIWLGIRCTHGSTAPREPSLLSLYTYVPALVNFV